MDPQKTRMLLFGFGAVLGGVLAVLLWKNFSHLGGWTVAAILLAVWSRWAWFRFSCCGGRIGEDDPFSRAFCAPRLAG